ncbi:MAG: hypothetical protein H6719_02115 [Sandaracinaceae bacterium]|nr:hypothetical protein [Sandaracinaceae bacterium]
MAKKGKIPKPKTAAEGVAEMERPAVKWRTIGLIAGGFVVLWITAFMIQGYSQGSPYGWIPVGVVGALTIAAIGFGIYIWRLTQRSRGIVDILAQATDEAGRKRAIEQLEAADSSDAMNALARAQLVSRDSPAQAMKILEDIDIAKAPAVVQDDVRANLGFLYLMNNKTKEARKLADELRLDRQPNAKAKAMYAAVSAEAFSRTGTPEEAKKLLETYDANDPEFVDVKGMLLRAQVYTYLALKKRGRAGEAMKELAQVDANMLAPWIAKKVRPEIRQMAEQALRSIGVAPKAQMKVMRK